MFVWVRAATLPTVMVSDRDQHQHARPVDGAGEVPGARARRGQAAEEEARA